MSGLTQKLCVLGPRLAIAWAGNPLAARMVLDAARERYGSTGVDQAEMAKLLQEFSFSEGKIGGLDLSIIGLSLLGAQRAEIFGFACKRIIDDHDELGKVYASGSGADHLVKTIIDISSVAKKDFASLPPNNIAIALLYTVRALIGEIMYAETLSDYFGGGFEITLIGNNCIQKIEEITYLFWFVNEADNIRAHFSRPTLMIKFSYLGSLLVIKRVLLGVSKFRRLRSGRQVTMNDSDVYVVPSLWDKKRDVVVPDSHNMQSRIMCSSFIFTKRTPLGFVMRIDVGDRSPFRIVFKEHSRTTYFDIEYDDEYFSCIKPYV